MEVHHHSNSPDPDNHRGRKKWPHYFWEFLMLFLAVTLGFFVENQREHYIERQREKQFMQTLVEDIHQDTAYLKGGIAGFTLINQKIDSLIFLLLDYNNLNLNSKQIYQHAVWLHYYIKITYAERTIEQLKNSGNFRLIRNKKVSASIMEYDGIMRNNIEDMQNEFVYQNKERMIDLSNGFFKISVAKKWLKNGWGFHEIELPATPYFLTTERSQIDRLINQLDQYSLSTSWFMKSLNYALGKAEQLDLLIKTEYKFK